MSLRELPGVNVEGKGELTRLAICLKSPQTKQRENMSNSWHPSSFPLAIIIPCVSWSQVSMTIGTLRFPGKTDLYFATHDREVIVILRRSVDKLSLYVHNFQPLVQH